MNKTEKRAEWIKKHKKELLEARTPFTPNPRGGYNAYYCKGMSGGGWGWWARAFKLAGVDCGVMPYWDGPDPTPSKAINEGMARYIQINAPKELI